MLGAIILFLNTYYQNDYIFVTLEKYTINMIDGRNDMQQSCSQSQQNLLNDIVTDFTKFDIYVFISVNVANLFLVYLSKFISQNRIRSDNVDISLS